MGAGGPEMSVDALVPACGRHEPQQQPGGHLVSRRLWTEPLPVARQGTARRGSLTCSETISKAGLLSTANNRERN